MDALERLEKLTTTEIPAAEARVGDARRQFDRHVAECTNGSGVFTDRDAHRKAEDLQYAIQAELNALRKTQNGIEPAICAVWSELRPSLSRIRELKQQAHEREVSYFDLDLSQPILLEFVADGQEPVPRRGQQPQVVINACRRWLAAIDKLDGRIKADKSSTPRGSRK